MAKVLKDSVSPTGVRLTTLIARFPRFILAELNTHRVLSRNSASSRAIPTERLIQSVKDNPFIPETFNSRIKGMGIGDELNSDESDYAKNTWIRASQDAIHRATILSEIGIDKSRANRILEPFMWHTAIISSTEWDNMMGLRCPDGDSPDKDFPAQWEFQQISILIRDAMKASEPESLEYGQWHIPLIHGIASDDPYIIDVLDSSDRIEIIKKVAARQLARVSFDTHTQYESVDVAVSKSHDLSSSAHFSPFEHIARPLAYIDTFNKMSEIADKIVMPVSCLGDTLRNSMDKMWCGNFRGWIQMRKEFKNEDNHLMALKEGIN